MKGQIQHAKNSHVSNISSVRAMCIGTHLPSQDEKLYGVVDSILVAVKWQPAVL